LPLTVDFDGSWSREADAGDTLHVVERIGSSQGEAAPPPPRTVTVEKTVETTVGKTVPVEKTVPVAAPAKAKVSP
jgi:hypothetical protein